MPQQTFSNDFKALVKVAGATGTAMWTFTQILEFFGLLELSQYGLLGLLFIGIVAIITGTTFVAARAHWRKETIVFCVFDHLLSYLPLFLAIEKGYFRKRGIEVKIIRAHGDRETWRRVEEGEAHFGLSDPIVMLHENAKAGRLVATIVNKATFGGITNKPLPYFHELAKIPGGLTIAGYEEPTSQYRALLALKNACNAKIKCFKSGEEEIAARNPEADITLLPEPFASEWVETHKGYSRVLDGPNLFGDLSWSGVYCTREYLNDHGGIVLGVVEALQDGLDEIRRAPLVAQEVAMDSFSGFDGTAVCTATLRMIKQSMFPSEVVTSRTEWSHALEFWGLSDKKLQFEHFVDNRFAEIALRRRANKRFKPTAPSPLCSGGASA